MTPCDLDTHFAVDGLHTRRRLSISVPSAMRPPKPLHSVFCCCVHGCLLVVFADNANQKSSSLSCRADGRPPIQFGAQKNAAVAAGWQAGPPSRHKTAHRIDSETVEPSIIEIIIQWAAQHTRSRVVSCRGRARIWYGSSSHQICLGYAGSPRFMLLLLMVSVELLTPAHIWLEVFVLRAGVALCNIRFDVRIKYTNNCGSARVHSIRAVCKQRTVLIMSFNVVVVVAFGRVTHEGRPDLCTLVRYFGRGSRIDIQSDQSIIRFCITTAAHQRDNHLSH